MCGLGWFDTTSKSTPSHHVQACVGQQCLSWLASRVAASRMAGELRWGGSAIILLGGSRMAEELWWGRRGIKISKPFGLLHHLVFNVLCTHCEK